MKALRESQSKAVDPTARAWRELTPEEREKVRPVEPLWYHADNEVFQSVDGPPEDELAALRAENERLKAQLAHDDGVKAAYWDHACKAGAENAQLRQRCAQMTANIECWTTSLNGKIDGLEAENERLRVDINELRIMRDALTEAISDDAAKIAELHARIEALQSAANLRPICEAAPPATSWLDRVAAGPQRIGIPLP